MQDPLPPNNLFGDGIDGFTRPSSFGHAILIMIGCTDQVCTMVNIRQSLDCDVLKLIQWLVFKRPKALIAILEPNCRWSRPKGRAMTFSSFFPLSPFPLRKAIGRWQLHNDCMHYNIISITASNESSHRIHYSSHICWTLNRFTEKAKFDTLKTPQKFHTSSSSANHHKCPLNHTLLYGRSNFQNDLFAILIADSYSWQKNCYQYIERKLVKWTKN